MSKASLSDRLYNKLSEKNTGNLFYSAYSIDVALGMTKAGAKGETNKALSDLLGVPEDVNECNRHYKSLVAEVNGNGSMRPFELVTANALWAASDYQFFDEYKKTTKDYYGGDFNTVDYDGAPDAAVSTINEWAKKNTRDKIPTLITRSFINKDTRLVLTNAIYFKGKWDNAFKKDMTQDGVFKTDESAVVTPLMNTSADYMYYEADDFQVLDMPYQGGELSMMVVLPTDEDGLSPLELKWENEGTYQQVVSGLYREKKVKVTFPRFKMETEYKLGETLSGMGAGIAFSNQADFTGIGTERLKISEVVHKAFVEVNEEGTEAAAATAVGMMRCTSSMRLAEPKVFKAIHPFMFLIRNKNTNTVLFQGRVVNPTKQK